MTNKEAKEILEWELNNFEYTDNEFVEAMKVAIKALEANNRILSLSNQCQEENGQTHIHIADVRRILRGDV